MFTQFLPIFPAVPNLIQNLSNLSASIKYLFTTRNNRRNRPPLLESTGGDPTSHPTPPPPSIRRQPRTYSQKSATNPRHLIHTLHQPPRERLAANTSPPELATRPASLAILPSMSALPSIRRTRLSTLVASGGMTKPECAQISGCVFFLPDHYLRYQHAQWVTNRYRSGTLREDDLNFLAHEYIRAAWVRWKGSPDRRHGFHRGRRTRHLHGFDAAADGAVGTPHRPGGSCRKYANIS
ncbi:MAG: hypothetical protein LQ346_008423 [Caloplaca aetnensis]|nr:MAG: hypothetical protein LQ346_008423 [Caloplaca aetnensis]